MKPFFDGQPQAGNPVVEDFGTNPEARLFIEDSVKRLFDGYINAPKFVAAAVSPADGGL